MATLCRSLLQPATQVSAPREVRTCLASIAFGEDDESNDQNLWMGLGEVTRMGAPSRG